MAETPASELEEKIVNLKKEHEILEDKLGSLVNDPLSDDLEIQALKKQKLQIKDSIATIESQLRG
ncbi:MAG: DUF465 domain-containing protein [Proteobacteria bacterium]|nr:MAG: DUF465 domain-containing protein [Pseudomonadota bacterium]